MIRDAGGEMVAWQDGFADLGAFVTHLSSLGHVTTTVMEVPLAVIVDLQAKAPGAFRDMRVEEDEGDCYFLLAMFVVGEHAAVLVSESFLPIGLDDEDEGEEEEEEEEADG